MHRQFFKYIWFKGDDLTPLACFNCLVKRWRTVCWPMQLDCCIEG